MFSWGIERNQWHEMFYGTPPHRGSDVAAHRYFTEYRVVFRTLSKICYINFLQKYRSSRPEVFCKKCVLKKFSKCTGKHFRQSLFYNKVALPGDCF